MKQAELPTSDFGIKLYFPTGAASSMAGRMNRIPQVNLVEEIVDRLRCQILSGEYGQDGVLPTEVQLGATFGVSRTVIREVMRTLRALGLVEVSRGRKPKVCPVDPQVAIDSLQALLVRSVVPAHQLAEIRRLLELLERACKEAQSSTDTHR